MDEQKITKLATFFEEVKRLILNGSKEIDEEDENSLSLSTPVSIVKLILWPKNSGCIYSKRGFPPCSLRSNKV